MRLPAAVIGPLAFRRAPGRAALPFARLELAAEVARWLEHLGAERRYSPKTLEAYARDMRQLLAFLAGHLGKKLTLGDLEKLAPRDVRAFLAARRAEGWRAMKLRLHDRTLASDIAQVEHGRRAMGDDFVILEQIRQLAAR